MPSLPLRLPQRRYTAVLPPPGPAWSGALMGLPLSASLLQVHGQPGPARVALAVSAAAAAVLLLGWLRYRSPGFRLSVMPAWAMLAIGLISLGSASSAVLGDGWVWFHLALWALGGLLGLVTFCCYLPLILRGRAGAPTFSWGLPMVTPMVTANAGLQAHAQGLGGVLLWVGLAGFLLSILSAPPVFARVYYYFFSRTARRSGNTLDAMAAPTTWIPVGIIGQSMNAALLLGAALDREFPALVYAWAMFIIAVPVGAFAHLLHYRAIFGGIAYSPTWWASTFPVGALCLGTHTLSLVTGLGWLDWISLFLLALLLVHVGVATLGGTIAITRAVLRRLPGRRRARD